MKKLIAMLLSLVMVFALTVPAFADGPDGPAPDPVLSPEPAEPDMPSGWTVEAEWKEVCEKFPEESAQFLKELDSWFVKNYPGYDSFEAAAEEMGGKEAAYVALFYTWNYQRERAKVIEDAITAHGGVPGQINVMVNGSCVKFTDAVPEAVNGRTMVPFRAILEALGAEVEYNGNDGFSCTAGGYKYTFTVGSDKVTVLPTAGNDKNVPQPEDIEMDCAPYVKNDRTYIPVRFISEALGYEVGWDSDYRTAIITDPDALAEKIDKDFTVLNKAMDSRDLPETAQQTTGSVTANITLLDSINGDTTKTLTGSIDGVVSPAGLSMKMDYDFSSLWDLIEGYIAMPLPEGGTQDQYTQQLALIKGAFSDTWEIRVDAEKGVYYYAMPIMNAMLRESGVDIADGAWLAVDLNAMYEELGESDIPAVSTIGELLAYVLASSGADDFQGYDAVMEVAAVIAKLAGDSKFTKDGATQTLTLTRADLEALTEGVDLDGLTWDALSKFTFTLKLEDSGDAQVDLQCNIAMNDGTTNLGDMASFSLKSTRKGGKTDSTVECHVKNLLKLTVESTQTTADTDKAPQTTPPEGADVVNMDDLADGLASGAGNVPSAAALAGLLKLAA